MLPSAPYGRAVAVGSVVALLATGASVLYTGDVLLAIDALFVAALPSCVVGAILTRPTVSRRKRIAETEAAGGDATGRDADATGRDADATPRDAGADEERSAPSGRDASPTEPGAARSDDDAAQPVDPESLPSADRSPISGNPVRQYRFGIAAIVVGVTLFAWSLGLQFFVR